jgi:hypothetical protein
MATLLLLLLLLLLLMSRGSAMLKSRGFGGCAERAIAVVTRELSFGGNSGPVRNETRPYPLHTLRSSSHWRSWSCESRSVR